MEKLVINVPDSKSNMVKHLLLSLGVAVPGHDAPIKGDYKKRLLSITNWTEADIKPIEDARNSFDHLKAEEW